MKLKVYSTIDNERIKDSVKKATEYFGSILSLSEINYIKPIERKSKLYDIVLSWALLLLKKTKSLSIDYLSTLDHSGYDGIILFVDKTKAKESSDLMGQHDVRDGISYIEIYDSNKYWSIQKSEKGYAEYYTSDKSGKFGTTQCLIHEVFHSLSTYYKIDDILHAFITEGQFDTYLNYLKFNINKNMETLSQKLHNKAIECFKTDVTPKDEVPDSVACAITVNTIHKLAFGDEIGGSASTYLLYNALLKRKDFKKVETPEPGDIIISPTGYAGKGGTLSNGHVGIVTSNAYVLSNNSKTGLLDNYFTLKSWSDYYGIKGKFPIYYFRKV